MGIDVSSAVSSACVVFRPVVTTDSPGENRVCVVE
jgi:hypothetical protein